MTFITFIYRIGKNKKIYYGKYTYDRISDDHDGLDNEIKPILIQGINKFREKNDLVKLKKQNFYVGIISFSTNMTVPTSSSDAEIKCFDFYCEKFYDMKKIYINGKVLE